MIFTIGLTPIFMLRIRIERTPDGAYLNISLMLFKLGFYVGISIAD